MKPGIRLRQWWITTSAASQYYRQTRGTQYLLKLAWWVFRKMAVSILHRDFCRREEWFHRMLSCCRCPIYNRSLQSCGIIGVKDADQNQLGCLCWMPLKAAFKSSKCWLEEVGYESRWKN